MTELKIDARNDSTDAMTYPSEQKPAASKPLPKLEVGGITFMLGIDQRVHAYRISGYPAYGIYELSNNGLRFTVKANDPRLLTCCESDFSTFDQINWGTIQHKEMSSSYEELEEDLTEEEIEIQEFWDDWYQECYEELVDDWERYQEFLK
jgi:hypothetical protein